MRFISRKILIKSVKSFLFTREGRFPLEGKLLRRPRKNVTPEGSGERGANLGKRSPAHDWIRKG